MRIIAKSFTLLSFIYLIGVINSCKSDDSEHANSSPIINNQSVLVNENSEVGTVVTTLSATDPDGDELTFTILSGNIGNAFMLNENSDELVVSSAILNYEILSSYNLTVQVSDELGYDATATITVTLNDLTITPVGLVAFYPFNGNAVDESPNSNNGDVQGPVLVEDRGNNANSAYYFDGVDDYINLGNSDIFSLGDYQEFTVSFWTKPSSNSIDKRTHIISKYISASDNRFYSFEQRPSNNIALRIYENGGSSNVEVLEYPIDTDWHNITWVYSDGNATLFIDGENSGNITFSFPIKTGATTANAVIGASHSSGAGELYDSNYYGIVDDIRFYNRVLSPEEILTIYHEFE